MNDYMLMDWIYLLVLMFSLAATAGFLAGLLGIGGGLVLVPGLYFIFNLLGYQSDAIMHVAVGTSLATIVATGISSARAHWKKGSVRFDLVKKIGFGIIIGVGCGTLIASAVSGVWLQVFFAGTLIILAGLMAINPEKINLFKDIPAQPWPTITGTGIGIVSTLMGIGGAADDAHIPVLLRETLAGLQLEPGQTVVDCTFCLLYTSPSPRDKRQSRMPSSA